MGKSSHHQAAPGKPATELSPRRVEQFRSQVDRSTWRYAAQGPLDQKVKSRVYCLGNAGEPPRQGRGTSAKLALLVIALVVGGVAVWRVFETRFARHGDGAQADGSRPIPGPGARPGMPGDGDLPPPIVPDFGPGVAPEEGSAETAVEKAGDPWATVLAAGGPPPAFEEVCFDDFPEQRSMKPAELRRWLRPQTDGALKLLAPWPANAALRLAMYPNDGFRIHVFGGEAGVTLEYIAPPRPSWVAYLAGAQRPRPERLAYVGSDNERFSRTGWGPIALHYDDGQLVMTRGNLRLLSAPLPAQPSEVYFEGNATWRGISLFRSAPPPSEDDRRPVVMNGNRPATLAWRHQLPPGAELQKTEGEGGPVRLVARRSAADAAVSLAVAAGLHEIVLQIGEATPGAGIFVGDKEGRPVARVALFRAQPGGGLSVEYSPPGERREQASYFTSQAHPLVRPGQWLRCVLGIGTFKCWTSADGQHWAPLPQAQPRGTPLGMSTLGLFCLSGEPERAITLRHLEIRELSALTSLASAEARKAAIAPDTPEVAAWLQAVAQKQPANLEGDDWRRGCALRTLAGAPARELAASLLESLVREVMVEASVAAQEATVEKRLAVLQEASLLWDGGDAERLLRCYDLFGQCLLRESCPRPAATLAIALARAELAGAAPVDILRGPCAKSDLLCQVVQGDWLAVQELRGQIDFWRRPSDPTRPTGFAGQEEWKQWLSWSGYLASRAPRPAGAKVTQTVPDEGAGGRERVPVRVGIRRVITPEEQRENAQRRSWQSPLLEQISKDGFGLIAEF